MVSSPPSAAANRAEVLKKDLESHNDRNWRTSPSWGWASIPSADYADMLEDEGVIGTAHIGIGTSITLGGTVKSLQPIMTC